MSLTKRKHIKAKKRKKMKPQISLTKKQENYAQNILEIKEEK